MYGLPVPFLRTLARKIEPNHGLALNLWKCGIFEARLLASMVDEPARVTERQLETWVRDFDSWALCDGCCQDLISKTRFAWKKAFEWSHRPEEYVKRAGFVLVSRLAFRDRTATDAPFLRFLAIIERESTDSRKYVRKGVNWALREIGKRNRALHRRALQTSEALRATESPYARWIGFDARRELQSGPVLKRLRETSWG